MTKPVPVSLHGGQRQYNDDYKLIDVKLIKKSKRAYLFLEVKMHSTRLFIGYSHQNRQQFNTFNSSLTSRDVILINQQKIFRNCSQ